MKQELQDKMVEILTSIQTATGKASDFALAQLPDIAQSYVLYGRVFAVLNTLCGLLVTGITIYGARWVYKNPWRGECGEDRGPSNVITLLALTLLAFIFFSCAVASMQELAMVWLAPKVWLLKELAQLAK